MDKLEKLLEWLKQERICIGNAGNPYVSDEYWNRYYDGQCDALDEVIEEVDSLMKENGNAP